MLREGDGLGAVGEGLQSPNGTGEGVLRLRGTLRRAQGGGGGRRARELEKPTAREGDGSLLVGSGPLPR